MINEIRDYYDSSVEYEWNRLNNPYSIIEFNSTMHLIRKYFSGKGSILDIGSGPGRYSLSLLKMGYSVSLLDISLNELNFARKNIEETGLKADNYYHKSASELDEFGDNLYDGILIMGPMYHLHKKEERLKVLVDSYRILKKDGVAIISYINTWGVLKASLSEFPESFVDIEHFDRYINGDLKFSKEESFTATFFTTPVQALEEVRDAGFNIISYAGAESYLSGLNMQMNNLKKEMPEAYENYLQKASEYCELPQYRDATEHLHIVVKK